MTARHERAQLTHEHINARARPGLRPGHRSETPCAETHAGCCGGWGRETPGYPISNSHAINFTFCYIKISYFYHSSIIEIQEPSSIQLLQQ